MTEVLSAEKAKKEVRSVWPSAWESGTGHIWQMRDWKRRFPMSEPLGTSWIDAASRLEVVEPPSAQHQFKMNSATNLCLVCDEDSWHNNHQISYAALKARLEVQPSSTVQGGEPVCANCGKVYGEHDQRLRLCHTGTRWFPKSIADALSKSNSASPPAAQEGQEVVEPKPADGWISVKDRLPEYGDDVLVVWKGVVQEQTYHLARDSGYGDGWIPARSHLLYALNKWTFRHWQPLPAPPLEATR